MSFWTEHQHKIDRANFRGQEQYLGNQDMNFLVPLARWCRAQYPEAYNRMQEDGDFGAITVHVDGKIVSRDLLDSVTEIDFIEQTVGQPTRVLDIGAGYGRLAHRMHEAWQGKVSVDCADTIPISSEVCAIYLAHRKVTTGRVLPRGVPIGHYDLACNVHSWPECTREGIRWWLAKLVELDVPHLFVVPHLDGEMLCNEDGRSFLPDIEERGYKIIRQWSGPECWVRDFYMFERAAP